MATDNNEQSWRKFQTGYLVLERKKKRQRKRIIAFAFLSLVLCAIAGIFVFEPFDWRQETSEPTSYKTPSDEEIEAARKGLPQAKLKDIVAKTDIIRTDKNLFFVDTPEDSYRITTFIDVHLQEYLLSLLAKAKRRTRGKPQRIALVVMEADTGKILAMGGFDLDNPQANPCTASDYPAASIFKIITAAAAVQELGYTPHTQLYFNGNKYTLYKRQLKEVKNKYSYKISFSRAFAESVNPVFGKLGKNHLGKDVLTRYAKAFGFNDVIESEMPFESGTFSADGSDYYLAELGSGFNTDTTISPMFGAMLVSAILNSGTMTQPRFVEHITNTTGEIIYKSQKKAYKNAVTPDTAQTMVSLMMKTVSSGTARKTFRRMSKDDVLSRLLIGGKTGSLYNKSHTVKYDWFTGFGQDREDKKKIALSIVVGHREYIGTRAATYAKLILKQYFKKPKDTTAQL